MACLADAVDARVRGPSHRGSTCTDPFSIYIGHRNYVPVDPVTATYKYLCPTGVREVETVVTELPAGNTAVAGGLVPGWSEYVTSCGTYCDNPDEQVTLTLPPGVQPTGTESGPTTSYPAGAAPQQAGYPDGSSGPDDTGSPDGSGAPGGGDTPAGSGGPGYGDAPDGSNPPNAPGDSNSSSDTNSPDAPANSGPPGGADTPADGTPAGPGGPGYTGAPDDSNGPNSPGGDNGSGDTDSPDAPAPTGPSDKTGTPADSTPAGPGEPGYTGTPDGSNGPGAPGNNSGDNDSSNASSPTGSSDKTGTPADSTPTGPGEPGYTGAPDGSNGPSAPGDDNGSGSGNGSSAPGDNGSGGTDSSDAPGPTGSPDKTGTPADSTPAGPGEPGYTGAPDGSNSPSAPGDDNGSGGSHGSSAPSDGNGSGGTDSSDASSPTGSPDKTGTPADSTLAGPGGPGYTGAPDDSNGPSAPPETGGPAKSNAPGSPGGPGSGTPDHTDAPSETAGSAEGSPAPTGSGSPKDPKGPKDPKSPASEYAPVLNAPTPSAGEDVATTVVSCTFTDIGDSGLTTRTLSITKEIPATATGETYTVSMTKSVAVCTACGGDGPTTVTLTVPAGNKTPVDGAPAETGSHERPPKGSTDEPGAGLTGSEVPAASTYVPVIDAPVPTEGEAAATTVVRCTYTDIGSSGLATRTTEVTREIPASATGETYTVSMTESVALCTVCGDKPTSVTLTVPAYETPAGGAPESSAPADKSPVDGTPKPSAPAGKGSEPPADHITTIPVVDAPTPTGGEAAYTTVIRTTYRDVCPTGFTTVTVDLTKTVPATVSTPFTVIMTESTTLCTGCGPAPTSVVVTVPASYETTTIKGVPSGAPDSPGSPDSPGPPGSDSPGSPGDDSPGSPGSDSPGSPGDDSPGSPGSDSPGSPGSDSPGSPGSDTPGSPGSDSPGSPGSGSPGSPNSPGSPDSPGSPGSPDSPGSPGAPYKPIKVTTRVPAVSVPATTAGEAIHTTVVTKEYVTICPTGFSTATTEITARVPKTYTDPVDVIMTTRRTVCANCGKGGKRTTVVLTVPVYKTTVIEQPVTPPAHTLTRTGPATTQTVVSVSGYVPVPIDSVPQPSDNAAPVVATTETYFATGSPATATETRFLTTEYETVGPSGIETATLTVTFENPSGTPSIDCVTRTTVCTACGGDGSNKSKTLTLTIPRVTSTLTFVPTTLRPSASAGFPPVNATQNGETYYPPARLEAQQQQQPQYEPVVVSATGAAPARVGVVREGVVLVAAAAVAIVAAAM